MKRALKFWILVAITILISTACSTKDSSAGQGQEDATNPPPQVRVEVIPSPTAPAEIPTEAVTGTPESAAPVQVYIAPPVDEFAISDEVEAMMNDLDRGLKNLDSSLK